MLGMVSYYRPWNLGQRSLKVIETDTDRSVTYVFLLTLHSNYEPISCRFQDKRRFQSKIAIFSYPVYLTLPLKGFPSELGTDAMGQKLEWWGYLTVEKVQDRFIRLDTIPACDRQTDRQTPHDGKDRAMQSDAWVKKTVTTIRISLTRVSEWWRKTFWAFFSAQNSVHIYGICAVSVVETIFDNVSTAKLSRLNAAKFCQLCGYCD